MPEAAAAAQGWGDAVNKKAAAGEGGREPIRFIPDCNGGRRPVMADGARRRRPDGWDDPDRQEARAPA